MPPKFIRISKTYLSRQFQEAISQVSHHQPSCNFYGSDISRKCLEMQLNVLKMHAQESSMPLSYP